MKKILLTALFCMLLSASCFAKGGESLISDELVADSLISSVLNGKPYTTVISDFVPEASKDFTEAKYAEIRKGIADNFGKVDDIKLVGYSKNVGTDGNYAGVNQLVFLGRATKGNYASFVVTVVNQGNVSKVIGMGMASANVTPK